MIPLIKLIISFIFLISFGVSGYFTYYFLELKQNVILAAVFAALAVASLVL